MRIVLNAVIARKNGGGATQIVLNYLNATLSDSEVEWYYIVSDEIADYYRDRNKFDNSHWLILPRQPKMSSYFKARTAIKSFLKVINPDIVYSILSPSYFSFHQTEVMRCCNAWDVIDRSDEAFSYLDWRTKLMFKSKTWLVRKMMRCSDFFITQTESGRDGIAKVTGIDINRIAVIPNVLPKFYQSIIPERKVISTINILYVASPAPHKNLEIVPKVAHILKYCYKLHNFRFLVTIPPEDASYASKVSNIAKELFVENEVINIGAKTQKELVDLYETATIGFFPSALETFSATLLEYMYFNLPVVASDKPFNTEVLQDAALYFKIKDAKSAAKAIYSILTDDELSNGLKEKSRSRINEYLDYSEHYNRTIDFFEKITKGEFISM